MGEALRLYHGSKSGIEGPISPIGSSVNDFGRGFYLGDEPSQPLTLICRGEKPTFYTCELDLAGLKVHRFDDGLDWALFVAWNRDMIPEEFRSAYDERFQALRGANDVLVGRIANDRVFQAVQFFFKRIITIETLCEVLNALNLGRQYCAISRKACQNIKILSERDVGPTERDNLRLKSDMQRKRADELTEKIIDSRRRTDGLFFDEICEKYASGEGLPI